MLLLVACISHHVIISICYVAKRQETGKIFKAMLSLSVCLPTVSDGEWTAIDDQISRIGIDSTILYYV